MKKKSAAREFVRAFIKSIVVISILSGLFYASYRITYWYLKHYTNVESSPSLERYFEDLDSDAIPEEVGKNLILSVDEESEKVKRVLIEVVNQDTGNIDYITVPSNMEFTMSYELYKKLATANGEIPQVIRLNQVHKYFSGESLCQCMELLLEDAMDVKFSYYTKIPFQVYKDMFETDLDTGIQKWKPSYEQEMYDLENVDQYEEFFDKYYEKVTSNLSRANKSQYIDAYLQGVPEQVAFSIVRGEKMDKVFVLAQEETNLLLNNILHNVAYSESNMPVEEEKEASSVGLSIAILNSTKVNGLASLYKEKLEAEGMNVVSIGNYNGGLQKKTKIYVKKQGEGEDLMSYFPNADLQVKKMEQNVDICIILGGDAANS